MRTTLADANESSDRRIHAAFAHVSNGIARPVYAHDSIAVDPTRSFSALDSTTIDACLSLFPWAKFRKHQAAVKMHMRLHLVLVLQSLDEARSTFRQALNGREDVHGDVLGESGDGPPVFTPPQR